MSFELNFNRIDKGYQGGPQYAPSSYTNLPAINQLFKKWIPEKVINNLLDCVPLPEADELRTNQELNGGGDPYYKTNGAITTIIPRPRPQNHAPTRINQILDDISESDLQSPPRTKPIIKSGSK